MKTIFDIDGTVMDTVTNAIKRASEHFRVRPTTLNPTHYNGIHECIPHDEDEVVAWVNRQWTEPNVYLTSEPFDGYKRLSELSSLAGYLSYRPYYLFEQTRFNLASWLIAQCSFAQCVGGRGLTKVEILKTIGATHYVGDGGDTAERVADAGIIAILIDKSYNKSTKSKKGLAKVASLKSAIDFLLLIEKESEEENGK